MNRALASTLQISTRHTGNSHMWTAETLGEYLEFLSEELRRQRRRHGLTAESKALILMDKATQHSSSTFHLLRVRLERAQNCILLHGGSYNYAPIPGGVQGSVSCACVFELMSGVSRCIIHIYTCNIYNIYNIYL